ncbi:zf-DNL-domain-containing protein [Jaminaea rosea]|uniref:Zf-DNL-domain-containing protein n=1 Tax=Jaminaea rosea TaxID=1569628 RepID=A0A316V0F7_9BASI|nr:zf-DNL-domain-containing protein [Jaminaea rosea]PWN31030.1 zf-DNL-domain-containing protein [Jaminaea rosea]
MTIAISASASLTRTLIPRLGTASSSSSASVLKAVRVNPSVSTLFRHSGHTTAAPPPLHRPPHFDQQWRGRAFCTATLPRRNAGAGEEARSGTPIGQIEQRLSLTFTCAVEGCGHRSTHEFAKRSYEKGIVIVQCPECKNRHLIADHLSWFKDAGEAKTVEEMVREKGGRVRVGRKALEDGVDQGETVEILSDSDAEALEAARGWESCFLRMLHILGPGISHLSLWHSESRILLRDAGQVRGRHRRLGALGPAWAWGEGDDFEDVRGSDDEEDHASEEEEDGTGSKAVINSAAELAAMRERARQKMPQWLRRELETKPVAEVARTHRAHLAPYGDVDAAVAAAATGTSDDLLTQHAVNSRKDKRQLKGCRPTSLSIILSLPLFENQEPALFASMLVFSRCKYLDCHFPVPAHAPKLLWLVSHLVRSPLERLKLSSTHATLVLGLPPFNSQQAEAMRRRDAVNARQVGSRRGAPQQQPINLALGLRAILEDEHLRCLLHWEFAGKHADAPRQLERAFTEVVVERGRRRGGSTAAPATARSEVADDGLDSVYGAPRDPCEDIEPVRVRLFQRNQGGYGKMKDRRDDFVQQSMGLSQGIWEKCGLWGEGDQVVESEKEWR